MSEPVDTPSAQILKKANETKTGKDSLDRVLTYKEKLLPREQMNLLTIIGPERARNMSTLSLAGAVYRVKSIDGFELFPPDDFEDLMDNLDQLGDEGVQFMYDVMFGPAEPPKKNRRTKEATKEATKEDKTEKKEVSEGQKTSS